MFSSAHKKPDISFKRQVRTLMSFSHAKPYMESQEKRSKYNYYSSAMLWRLPKIQITIHFFRPS
jgi:trehalose-6-phosphate synthase